MGVISHSHIRERIRTGVDKELHRFNDNMEIGHGHIVPGLGLQDSWTKHEGRTEASRGRLTLIIIRPKGNRANEPICVKGPHSREMSIKHFCVDVDKSENSKVLTIHNHSHAFGGVVREEAVHLPSRLVLVEVDITSLIKNASWIWIDLLNLQKFKAGGKVCITLVGASRLEVNGFSYYWRSGFNRVRLGVGLVHAKDSGVGSKISDV